MLYTPTAFAYVKFPCMPLSCPALRKCFRSLSRSLVFSLHCLSIEKEEGVLNALTV